MPVTLDSIALKYGTDKSSAHHNYTRIYEKYFEPIRKDDLILLEIGFGGYEHYTRGGEGAKTWLEYFPHAKVTSIDIHPKAPIPSDRFKFYQGSETDEAFLKEKVGIIGNPDIIINDGSHVSPNIIKNFQILFPFLKPGGIMVVEDLEASYWEEPATNGDEFHGCRAEYGDKNSSSMNYFKWLTDSLNYEHSRLPDMGIDAIHFHRKMVWIFKK